MKTRGIRLFALLLVTAAVLSGLPLAAEEPPSVAVSYFALSHDNTVSIEYAVDCRGFVPTASNIGMLFWTAEPSDPTRGRETLCKAPLGYTEIENKNYSVFRYDRLTAEQMTDDVWARAYAVVGGRTYYSKVVKYSIVTYAARKLGLVDGVPETQDPQLTETLISMLRYGAAFQKLSDYRTDALATDILPSHRFTVTFDSAGGSPVPSRRVFENRPLSAPPAPSRHGFSFLGWFLDGRPWNFSTPITQNLTLTARWSFE